MRGKINGLTSRNFMFLAETKMEDTKPPVWKMSLNVEKSYC